MAGLALTALLQVPPHEQELAPGTRYDPSIPTVEQVLGHDPRDRITPPDQIVRYLRALAEADSARTRLVEYAVSWEGRPLFMLLIASADRIARLDDIASGLQRLSDPRLLDPGELEALIAELPVVTALVHGVHGNEISSSGAALAEAYHLLAARDDPVVDLILRESLVMIDPAQNPDGRARYVAHNLMGAGLVPDPATVSAEHDEPWPGGRTNHYLFDMNRDAVIQTQPETRGKIRLFLEYRPHVVVDLHEMSGNSTYFFPPTADPANPWLTEQQFELMDVFGAANAEAFDERGFPYFNRETYDAFYPGYSDMWPMIHGAVAMTYEQASARALVLERDDGDLLTYGDGVLHHFTAAIRTAETAARHRDRILREYAAFRRSAIDLGAEGPAEYVLHSAHDPGMAERLARVLVQNGIEVRSATGPVSVAGRVLPAHGTFLVPAAQPAYRVLRNLLDADTPMDSAFVRTQIERRANRQNDQIYDVTAWSVSALFDVEVLESARTTGAAGPTLAPAAAVASAVTALPDATVGYLLPWTTNTAAAVAEALREGLRVRSAGAAFTLGGREYGIGTAIVRTRENPPTLPQQLGSIAARHRAEVVPVDDSYVREGMSLGSGRVSALREPRVLLVYDRPGSTYSVGWARYVLERRYGQRVTAVRADSMGRVTLSDFDVIVVPSGNYSGVFGESLVAGLSAWLRDGGTLITMAESTRWAASESVGLLDVEVERRGGRPVGEPAPERPAAEQPIDVLAAIAPLDEAPEQTPGAILRVLLDTDHWLSSGTDGEIGVVVDGTRIFSPIRLDSGVNVGRYAEGDAMVIGGIVWEEARPQLANKPYLIHQPVGRGGIVAFAEDPNFRAYAEASELLFMNAILLGPGR